MVNPSQSTRKLIPFTVVSSSLPSNSETPNDIAISLSRLITLGSGFHDPSVEEILGGVDVENEGIAL